MSISYRDKTYCATPHCTNECGRKMTDFEKTQQNAFYAAQGFNLPVSYAYFCGEPQSDPKPSKPTEA